MSFSNTKYSDFIASKVFFRKLALKQTLLFTKKLPEFHTITSSRYYSLSNDVAERRKRLEAIGSVKFRLYIENRS